MLHQWTCPTCGYPYNWAEVVVTDGIISDIRGVALNQATLTRAHFVVDEIRDVAADLAGIRSARNLDEDQVIQTLRERLPAEDRWHL